MSPSVVDRGRLLSVAEAAQRLGMPVATVRREIRAGRLKVLRRGRALGIYEAWCESYIEAHTSEATPVRGRVEPTPSTGRPTGIRDLMPPRRLLRVN